MPCACSRLVATYCEIAAFGLCIAASQVANNEELLAVKDHLRYFAEKVQLFRSALSSSLQPALALRNSVHATLKRKTERLQRLDKSNLLAQSVCVRVGFQSHSLLESAASLPQSDPSLSESVPSLPESDSSLLDSDSSPSTCRLSIFDQVQPQLPTICSNCRGRSP